MLVSRSAAAGSAALSASATALRRVSTASPRALAVACLSLVSPRRARAPRSLSHLSLSRPLLLPLQVAKERPLSPHLTIYRFRVNMITSVLFRGASSPRDASSLCASFFFRVARSSRPAAAACLVLAAYPLCASPFVAFIWLAIAGTGCVMVGGLSALAIASLPSSMTLSEALWNLQQYPAANAIVKFGVVFPLSYHYLGGLRHLVRARARCVRARARCAAGRAARACLSRALQLPPACPLALPSLAQAWDNVLPGWHTSKLVNNSAYGAVALAAAAGVIGAFVEFKGDKKKDHH